MSDPQAPDRDVNRAIRSWLHEDRREDASRVAGAVLDHVETTPQRRATWWRAWRMPFMNKFVSLGLGAAAVVVALVIGTQLLGAPAEGGVGVPPAASPSPTPDSSPTVEPSPSAWAGIPAGRFTVTGTDDPVQVTVDIASPGWQHSPEVDFLYKNDDGLDSPQSVGGALAAWSWPPGTGFDVYGDPCQWSTTIPATPATTPAEIAAAFQTQAETAATAPADITVGGYSGKAVTLTVPMSYEVPGASREEEFGACDGATYGFYGSRTDTEPARYAQGPGQVDELWILDVDGAIVILDATYGPAAPLQLVEEMRAMAASASFAAP